MVFGRKPFNTFLYLALVVAFAFGFGCQSPERKQKKLLSTLRVHLETNSDGSDRNQVVAVPRGQPSMFTVLKAPFLSEAYLAGAKLTETVGGFVLQLQFDRQGTWLLEQYSAQNVGRHFAVFSQFPGADGKLNTGRWLAAPRIRQRIANGMLTFTPDATREEAEQIVLGLNNVAKKLKNVPE